MPSQNANYPTNESYLNQYSGTNLLAVCITFIALETTFVVLRYYARHLTSAGLGLDDAIIPLAWMTNVALCIVCITAVRDAGVGRHLDYVLKFHPAQLENWAKDIFAVDILYLASAALPKVTILCFYLRVFTRRDARMTCYCLLGFVAVSWIAYLLAVILQCIPVAYQWNKAIPGGRCFNVEAYYKTTSVPNILTDLIILVLPIPTVINLQTSRVRKVECLLVFMVGSIGLIGSCIRMSTFFTHDAFTDNTWHSIPLMGWTVVEPGMYLLAACLLTFRPLARKVSPKQLVRRLSTIIGGSKASKSASSHSDRERGALPGDEFIELHRGRDERNAN